MHPMSIALDVAEMVAFLAILTLLVKPVGAYMARVFQGERNFLSWVLSPLERLIYRVAGVAVSEEMDWKGYAAAMLLFNGLGIAVVAALLRLQGVLPLNPQHFPAFHPLLALNTAVSFVTNTNWQAYSGESAASTLTQMSALAVQNFFSAATGSAANSISAK